jgi:hypothetical protein
MKVFDAFRLGGLATRRFPVWLHAFNILCGIAALAIAGFGIYFWVTREQRTLGGVLSGPRGARVVDRDILVSKLEPPDRALALGRLLRRADDDDALIVLEAAREEVLPGGVVLAGEVCEGKGRVADLARRMILEAILDPDGTVSTSREAFGRKYASDEPGTRFLLAFRLMLVGDARVRRKAVERLTMSHDPRAAAALAIACELPPDEEATADLARRHAKAEAAPLPDLTRELVGLAFMDDPDQNACAIVGLGMMRVRKAEPALVGWVMTRDPIIRARAAWALGRIGAKDARPALETALAKETYAPAREAMQKALDRLPR